MIKLERLIIYPLLAVIALAAFLDLRPIQAQREPGEATFRKLTIVDQAGRPRIQLDMFEGHPRLELLDPNGKPRLALAFVEGQPGLGLADKKGRVLWSAP